MFKVGDMVKCIKHDNRWVGCFAEVAIVAVVDFKDRTMFLKDMFWVDFESVELVIKKPATIFENVKVGDKVRIISLDGPQQLSDVSLSDNISIGSEIYIDGVNSSWGIYNAEADWWIDFSDVELVEYSVSHASGGIDDYSQVLHEMIRARKEGVSKEIATTIINLLLEN